MKNSKNWGISMFFKGIKANTTIIFCALNNLTYEWNDIPCFLAWGVALWEQFKKIHVFTITLHAKSALSSETETDTTAGRVSSNLVIILNIFAHTV